MTETKSPPDKKRHHVVPVTYLNGFTDSAKNIYAYRKDTPQKPLYQTPESIAFRKYYYSQPIHGGGWDHNTLENFFSDTTESKWNDIVAVIHRQQPLSLEQQEVLFQFLGILRVRVPAARDAIEYGLAESVKSSARLLDEMGELPSKPVGYENILDDLVVSIDPHQSIHAMGTMLKGFARLLGILGFEIIRNQTNTLFITSDNPVICFDPDVPDSAMKPYLIDRNRLRAELLFPIDSQHVLRGHSSLRSKHNLNEITYRTVIDAKVARKFNRFISKFAYEYVFASGTDNESIIQEYAHLSPMAEIYTKHTLHGNVLILRHTFGPRRKKPKWEDNS